MKKYNINKLLERKKELEEKIREEKEIDRNGLQYTTQKVIDHVNAKNNRTIIPRKKINLVEYTQKINGLLEELSKVKTAIQKHNAKTVFEMLNEREALRNKIDFLNRVLKLLPSEKNYGKEVTREGKEEEPLETTERTIEPMFKRDEAEKQLNNLSAQERKINTEIQKS